MGDRTCFFRPIEGESAEAVELVVPAEGVRRVTAREAASLAEIVRIVSEHQERQRRFYSAPLPGVVRHVIGHYHDLAANALRRAKEFRDDMLVQLRALSLVVEMAGSAATHREKDARLRGVSELIEGAVAALRRQRFEVEFSTCPGMFEDIFRSDYPTRELLGRIRELEAEVARLNAEGEPSPEGDAAAEIEF